MINCHGGVRDNENVINVGYQISIFIICSQMNMIMKVVIMAVLRIDLLSTAVACQGYFRGSN